MKEQSIDLPCPICSSSGNVNMIAHIDEIPYFGEHTQVTILCHDCGWRQTDFIPAEGKKAGGWSMVIDDEEKLRARVVRSSSCTVSVPELDLEVNPERVPPVMFPTSRASCTGFKRSSTWWNGTSQTNSWQPKERNVTP